MTTCMYSSIIMINMFSVCLFIAALPACTYGTFIIPTIY